MLAELYAMNRQWDLGLDAVARALARVEDGAVLRKTEAYRLKVLLCVRALPEPGAAELLLTGPSTWRPASAKA